MFTDSDALSPKNTSRNVSYYHIASYNCFDFDLNKYMQRHWFMINITGDEKYLEKIYEQLNLLTNAMIDVAVPEDPGKLINASIERIVPPKHNILSIDILTVCTNDQYDTLFEKLSDGFNIQIMSKDSKPVSLIIF